MSDIKFNCPRCDTRFAVDAAGAGMAVLCPSCSQPIIIPSAAAESPTGSPIPLPRLPGKATPSTVKWWLLAVGASAVLILVLVGGFLNFQRARDSAQRPQVKNGAEARVGQPSRQTGPTRPQATSDSAASRDLPVRGLYVQFERRGWPSEWWSGQAISKFNEFDPVVGHTVAEEVSLQLDAMRQMGVNTIAFELRSCDPESGPYVPPKCIVPWPLGFQYPQPTTAEITNLIAFYRLVEKKGMKVFLRLVNNHMEENPPTNNARWLGSILRAVKDLPAFELVLFEGDVHMNDINGDGVPEVCGGQAEPPLWLGPRTAPARYVKWAISYGQSLGVPARKMSAEAIIGDALTDAGLPTGPGATDGHFWQPIVVLKSIFDSLAIPDAQRTYAVSFYEHRRLATHQGIPGADVDPNTWADMTLENVFDTVGRNNGTRVVAVEMGLLPPAEPNWTTEQALESLVTLMRKYGMDGGCFWRWTSFENPEDADAKLATPVMRRGREFTYTPVRDVLRRLYGTAHQR